MIEIKNPPPWETFPLPNDAQKHMAQQESENGSSFIQQVCMQIQIAKRKPPLLFLGKNFNSLIPGKEVHSHIFIIILLQVRLNATISPEKVALSWIGPDCELADSRTYAQLWNESTLVAKKLQRRHVVAGDRVMIVYPFGLDFMPAFLACLRMGMLFMQAAAHSASAPYAYLVRRVEI